MYIYIYSGFIAALLTLQVEETPHTYRYRHAYVYVNIYVYIYIHIYIFIYIYIYIYIYVFNKCKEGRGVTSPNSGFIAALLTLQVDDSHGAVPSYI